MDKEINDLLDKIDNKSREEQIKYLKNFSNMLIENQEKIENGFIVGTFISGYGLGLLLNNNIYLSLGIIGTGVIISISSSKKKLKKRK
ncbi:MAG: hypothetical protein J6K21_01685 [Bacilli bacterium]|nr:hypothetical protein [Bacilli bacterium]